MGLRLRAGYPTATGHSYAHFHGLFRHYQQQKQIIGSEVFFADREIGEMKKETSVTANEFASNAMNIRMKSSNERLALNSNRRKKWRQQAPDPS